MSKIIDADYTVVRPEAPKTPWVGPGDIAELFRTLIGLGFLAMACYAIHLFLATNFG
jgi:hypothetical protein